MFYSHEILTSRQYGVATIWLVATTSNASSTRRVTRKAIQEVDVQRACGKILEPGAPIALRLQGNLLYGVSRVHSQQCTYLAADAKKIQDQMRFYFNAFSGNQLDSEAAKARPEANLIEDDRTFDPLMPLPQFNLETLVGSMIDTQKTSSQMSPPSSQFSVARSPGQGFAIQLDIDHSSSSGYHGSPFGLGDLSSVQKSEVDPLLFTDGDDVFGAHGDWGIEIDQDGNIVETADPIAVDEEPQLPPLPEIQGGDDMADNVLRFDERPIFDDQDIIMREEPLPEAEPFPERQRHEPWQHDKKSAQQESTRRKRKVKRDDGTQLPRRVLSDWQSQYLENCCTYLNRPVSATQAKRNAMLLTFGLGIGNIGQSMGVPGLIHPLAVDFSGDVLFTTFTGIEIQKARGRRRTASEAIEDEEGIEERRVRPRLIENNEAQEQEKARAGQEDEVNNIGDPFDDEVFPEVGRDAEHPMSDHLSSTLLPWNRGSSAIPGSSARVTNSAQQGRDLSSPLGKRGNSQEIVRYSDDAPTGGFGSDADFGGGFGSADSFPGMQDPSLEFEDHEPNGEFTAAEIEAQNDHLFAQLDREGHNFAKYMQDAIDQNGERRKDEDVDINRRWLAFDDMFIPQATPRSTAAQAFYHTLCLVTKDKMYVEQYEADQVPFGAIWIGMKVVAALF
ncbi:Rec8 like protein-domain-containing protein [Xylaria arbuscula]|nr:Rec8 like protein-domain-containing protein [Xylaria arbuscula]